eukprot:TRINITY_DN2167_c0_g1_i12.p1 TRINITY_DN2167_c0_g1~~TRINITY_DN2167_c0_g1_i12.p1  ORF type:complete len:184 (-),score=42.64 TRINITY_DN2167_c0_g1_i12:620-1171(-)
MLKGLMYCAIVFLVIAFIIIMTFIFLSTSKIPYYEFECAVDSLIGENDPVSSPCQGNKDATFNVNVSFIVYAIGFLCFLGWFFLALYAGIGLIILPTDFMIDYIDRPRKLTNADLQKITPKLLGYTTKLLRDGEELKKKYAAETKFKTRNVKTVNKISELENSVNALEAVSACVICRKCDKSN